MGSDRYGGAASLSENCDDNGQCLQDAVKSSEKSNIRGHTFVRQEFMCRYKARH